MDRRQRPSDGPDAELARDLERAAAAEKQRAKPALAFLVAYAVVDVVQGAVSALAPSAGSAAEAGSRASVLVLVALWLATIGMAVTSLFWLHLAVSNSRRFGPRRVAVTPGSAVMAFLIPLVNLVRPFFVLRDLVRASDPDQVPDAPRYEERTGAGYRDSPMRRLPPIRWARATPLAAWWATWVASRIAPYVLVYWVTANHAADLGFLNPYLYVSQALATASAILAVLLARGIAGHREELYRRMIAEAAGGAARA